MKPTPFQKEIAKALGISLRGASIDTAALLIRAHIAPAINLVEAYDDQRSATEKQIKFARDLGVYAEGDPFEVCRTRIQCELTRRNAVALRRLRLKSGDVVEYSRMLIYNDETSMIRSQHIVSSIGEDMRVYFKNPAEASGGWPSQLKKLKSRASAA